MAWYAVDAIDDALEATRSFLFPFTRGRWLRLAVIVFFLGGGSSLNVPSNVPSPPSGGTPSAPQVSDATATLLLAVVVAIVILGIVLAVVSSVMRFVFLDALRTDEVRIRTPFRRRFWTGIRFLLFNLVVGLLVVAGAAMVVIALTAGGIAVVGAIQSPDLQLGVGLAGAVVLGLIALALVVGVVSFFHFTRAFVAPTMLVTGSGVLAAWGRFWGVLTRERWQFLVYLVVRLLLNIGVAIAAGILTAVAGGIIVLGGLVVGLVVVLALGGLEAALASTAGLVLLGVVAAVTVVAVLVLVILPVRIVVQTFLTGYELAVLGDAEPGLALLADFGDGGDGADEKAATGDRGGLFEPGGDESAADEAGEAGEAEEPSRAETETPFEFGVVEDDESVTDDGGGATRAEEASHEAGDRTDDSDDRSDRGTESDDDDEESDNAPYWRDS